MLDPVKLQTLVEVASVGSIAAAADRVGVSASAASQQITSLERELGVQLLERGARSVRLTPAGSELARKSVAIIEGLTDAVRVVQDVSGLRAGTLRIGSFASAVPAVLAPAVARFVRLHAGVTVCINEVEPENAVAAVVDGHLDLALTHRYSFAADYATRGLRRIDLFTESLLVAVSSTHQLTQHGAVGICDLAGEAWVAPVPDEGFQAPIEHLARRGRFEAQIRHRCDNYEMTRSLVASGLGIALIPRQAATTTPGLRYLNISDPIIERRIEAIHRTQDPNPAIAKIIAMLQSRTP